MAPASPRSSRFWSLSSRFLPLARCFALFFVCFFFLPLAARLSPWHVGLSSAPPPPPCPLATSSLSSPLSWVGGGEGGGGGGPRCPSSAVSTSQARRRHEARHLSLCRGGGGLPCSFRRRPSYPAFAPPVPPPLGLARRVLPTGTVVWSVPHPLFRCLPTLPLCPRGGGGRCPPLPSFISHPWGGGGVWGGGGLVVFPSLHACRRHDASTAQARGAAPVPLQGGGDALWLPSSPFLPCVRTPGGPPAGACTARALYGHGRVVRPAPSRRCLPTLPLCPRGGGAFRPPLPASPTLGGAGVCGGGAGAPMSSSLRCTHVAGTTQARRKHGVRHLAAAGGGGVLLWAFPPFSMV